MSKTPLHAACRRLRRLWRREDGTATIEFALFLPITLLIFMASMEAGFYMLRHVMLERGLDLTLRDFRLGRLASLDHDEIRDRVCERTPIIGNCQSELKVWMQPVNTFTWDLPLDPVYCGDRNDPLTNPLPGEVDQGGSNEIMLIRICVLESPMFPSTPFSMRLRADSQTGDYQLTTSTVVVNEPR